MDDRSLHCVQRSSIRGRAPLVPVRTSRHVRAVHGVASLVPDVRRGPTVRMPGIGQLTAAQRLLSQVMTFAEAVKKVQKGLDQHMAVVHQQLERRQMRKMSRTGLAAPLEKIGWCRHCRVHDASALALVLCCSRSGVAVRRDENGLKETTATLIARCSGRSGRER